jgi:hypothetical protein
VRKLIKELSYIRFVESLKPVRFFREIFQSNIGRHIRLKTPSKVSNNDFIIKGEHSMLTIKKYI